MANELQDKILLFYQDDYFEKRFEDDGEHGPLLFEMKLAQCYGYFQVALRKAYVEQRGKHNGADAYARCIARTFLEDKQLKGSLDLAIKLLPTKFGKDPKNQEIANALHDFMEDKEAKTKLTWKQLVNLVNKMLDAHPALPKTLKDAPLYEEYNWALKCREFQKFQGYKGEAFASPEFENLQAALPDIKDAKERKAVQKKFDKYAKALELAKSFKTAKEGEGVAKRRAARPDTSKTYFGARPEDAFSLLRIQELKDACDTWMYNQGYSVASAHVASEDGLDLDEARSHESELGRTSYIVRADTIYMPLVSRYFEIMGERRGSSSAQAGSLTQEVKRDIDQLIAALIKARKEGLPQGDTSALPLVIDPITGVALYLADTTRVKASVPVMTSYCFVVAPYDAAYEALLKSGKSQATIDNEWSFVFSLMAKEDAYRKFEQLAYAELGVDDLAVDCFSYGYDLKGCPNRYKRFFVG